MKTSSVILLLVCFAGAQPTDSDESESTLQSSSSEEGEVQLLKAMEGEGQSFSGSHGVRQSFNETDGTRESRLFLNPLSILGNPPCTYNQDQGLCYGEVECVLLAGNYGNYCPNLAGLCCLYYRTCTQRTKQVVAHFRNPQYPLAVAVPAVCDFRVIRRSDTFCGLRLDAPLSNLPTTGCTGLTLYIGGAGTHKPLALCQRTTALTYTLGHRYVEEVTLTVNSSSSATAAWKIKVTQVPCTEYTEIGTTTGTKLPTATATGTKLPTGTATGTGTGATTGTGTLVPPPKPITAKPPVLPVAPSPPAPPTSAKFPGGRCVSRKGSSNTDVCVLLTAGPACQGSVTGTVVTGTGVTTPVTARPGIFSTLLQKLQNIPSFGTRPNPPQGPQADDEGLGPFLTDRTYDKDHVKDSDFQKYAGPPSPLSNKVTNGRNAGVREFPWQVAMQRSHKYHCGGSIIGPQHILTAAHCVQRYKPENLIISVGDWNLTSEEDGRTLRVHAEPGKLYIHEGYDRYSLQNDLAIFKLSKPIVFSDRVKAVCLPSNDIPTERKSGTVTGWGRDETQTLKVVLQKLTSTIISTKECDDLWHARRAPKNFIVDRMLCMDASRGDSCNGDSGGPLIMEESNGGVVQVGLVSFGSGSCTDKNLPGVYTRLSKYLDWIESKVSIL